MTIVQLTEFFKWCTIINIGMLMFSFAMLAFAGDFVYRMHGKWFPMPRETFNVVIYSFVGFYKILIIVLNIIPYIALLIIG